MPSFIQAVIDRYAASPVRLLDILRELQSEFQYISTEATECVAKSLNIPRTQIISIIEFYSFLHANPRANMGSVARVIGSEERLVFRHNYPAKAINCL
jgi:NADH:ubiquinone oxidoreductase subunit E